MHGSQTEKKEMRQQHRNESHERYDKEHQVEGQNGDSELLAVDCEKAWMGSHYVAMIYSVVRNEEKDEVAWMEVKHQKTASRMIKKCWWKYGTIAQTYQSEEGRRRCEAVSQTCGEEEDVGKALAMWRGSARLKGQAMEKR